MNASDEKSQAKAAMQWLADAGVSAILDETPQNRLSVAEKPAPLRANAAKTSGPAVSQAQAPATKLEEVGHAQALVDGCASLEELKAALEGFDGCALKATATQMVFADGDPQADVMLIGEAPGRDEDIEGKPFVGAAGQLLNKILSASGFDRAQVYITNIVPWRPPGNRKPTPLETQICLPFVKRHIALVNPKCLLLLGATPTTALTGLKDGITRLRGAWQRVDVSAGGHYNALPTFHPAYLLRQPSHKSFVWTDMLKLKEKLAT